MSKTLAQQFTTILRTICATLKLFEHVGRAVCLQADDVAALLHRLIPDSKLNTHTWSAQYTVVFNTKMLCCDTRSVHFYLQADDVAALLHRLIPDSKLGEFQGQLAAGEAQLQQQLERTTTLELDDGTQQQGGTPGGDAKELRNIYLCHCIGLSIQYSHAEAGRWHTAGRDTRCGSNNAVA
jgi:hypothetical protein